MKEKLIYLLEDLKENYTPKKSSEIIEILCEDMSFNEADDFLKELDNRKDLFDNQNTLFYDELAIKLAEDLAHYTLVYFSLWEPLFRYFNSETRACIFKAALNIPINADATAYIKGFQALESEEFEVALNHFDSIDNYVSSYFVGYCYLCLDNYENSIKRNEFFIKRLIDFMNLANTDEYSIVDDPDFRMLLWNVYNDLGYCYNRTNEFVSAKENYEKSLEIFSLEEVHDIFNFEGDGTERNEFIIFVNNYIHCLSKSNEIKKSIAILRFVISVNPTDLQFYKSQLFKLESKVPFSESATPIGYVAKIKKPYGKETFTASLKLSKENLLEELIVEQIRRKFKVFNKNLEVYQDHLIYGKQYHVQNCGRLDLLLIDKETDILYVVELKRDGAGIEVVHQVERYMNGLNVQLHREIKGIVCLHEPNLALKELVATKDNIDLFIYEFQFTKL